MSARRGVGWVRREESGYGCAEDGERVKKRAELGHRCPVLISPADQESATIEGQASTQGGITIKIGRATTMELSRFNEDRFVQICEAVSSSHFTEFAIYSTTGRPLYSRIELDSKGRKVRLGGHQLFWWLYPNKRKERFHYKPYY